MATTTDIEEVFGISKYRIDSWARARDSNYLLVQFLKSFSRIDLQLRVREILESTGTELVSPKMFIDTLVSNLKNSGINEFSDAQQENVRNITKVQRGLRRGYTSDALLEINGNHYIIDFKHLLPSTSNLERQIKRILEYADNNKLNLIRIIYIANNKNRHMKNNTIIQENASFYRFDDIAENLYKKKVIITGYI